MEAQTATPSRTGDDPAASTPASMSQPVSWQSGVAPAQAAAQTPTSSATGQAPAGPVVSPGGQLPDAAVAAPEARRWPWLPMAAALTVIVGLVAAFFLLRGDDKGAPNNGGSDQTPSAVATTGEGGTDLMATVTFAQGAGATETAPDEQATTEVGEATATTAPTPSPRPSATPRPNGTTVVIKPVAPTPTGAGVELPVPTASGDGLTPVATGEALNVNGNLATVISQDFSTGDVGPFLTGAMTFGSAALTDGKYVLSVPSDGWQSSAPDPPIDLADGAIAVKVRLTGNGAAGIIGRSQQNDDGSFEFYLCWLNGQGGAGCHLWKDNNWTELFTLANGTVQLQDENTLLMIVRQPARFPGQRPIPRPEAG